MSSLCFCLIATNKYNDFAKTAISTITERYRGSDYIIRLASDNPKMYNKVETNALSIMKIPSYVWPEIANKRYEILLELTKSVENEIFIYLDADTVIRELDFEKITSALENSDFCFVLHPGFWNQLYSGNFFGILMFLRSLIYRFSNYRRALKICLTKNSTLDLDLISIYAQTGSKVRTFSQIVRHLISFSDWKRRGTWETREKSMAYVPKGLRVKYVCGGVWLGKRYEFRNFCKIANDWTHTDLANGIQAKWFDESYANAYYVSCDQTFALNPNWAWAEDYPNISKLKPYIEVIDKTKF